MTAPWSPARSKDKEELAAALDELRSVIERRPVDRRATTGGGIDLIADRFTLSRFERDLLLLCAGVELDADFAGACRAAAGGPPSFAFALAALPGAHWSAITPVGPLRYWRLIEVQPGERMTAAPIRIDERVLHFIAGVSHLDERLQGLIRPGPPPGELTAAQARTAARIAALWTAADRRGEAWDAVQITGDPDGVAAVATAACAEHHLRLNLICAADLPTAVAERASFERLWAREAALADGALLVETADADSPETLRAAVAFAAAARPVVLVASRDPLPPHGRPLPRFEVASPDRAEQRDLWRRALGTDAVAREAEIERVVAHFDLGPAAIAAAGVIAADTDLWTACRNQARGPLDDLAQRIEPAAGWEELVLPPAEHDILREIVANVRGRARVYDDWGFARKSSRGLGVSALFAGTSGTGKTLAAEIIAHELSLDLFRIDLSQMVSKYIGETEKNLRRVFDTAEAAGAVLLFDEADALFGKRSEVKDSHDRYANLEVSYLLQRMECYRGLAILTTNLPQAIDPAFKRRLRFIVQFPFPEAGERAEIWRRIFPAETPTEALDIGRLAQLNVAGGNIRNIALGAAFLAADGGGAVSMGHVRRAARAEYAKIGRAMTGAEIAGWDAA